MCSYIHIYIYIDRERGIYIYIYIYGRNVGAPKTDAPRKVSRDVDKRPSNFEG